MFSALLLGAALTAAQWRADIALLAREMPRRHKNLFHDMTRTQFESAIDDLRMRAGKTDDLQMVAAIQRVGAMAGDAHTGIVPTTPRMRFTALPLRLYVYSDGVFVQAAPPELRDLVGAKVLRVGSTGIAEVLHRLRAITDHSNDSTVRAFIPYKIVRPEILRFFKIIDDVTNVPFTFDVNGVEETAVLHPMGRTTDGSPIMGGISAQPIGAAVGSNWIDGRGSSNVPLYLQHIDEPYWFVETEGGTLYIQCNEVLNAENHETLEAFFDHAYRAADEHHANRVVLDLRFNGGGDNTLILPIVHGIIKRDVINRKGHFFVITGRFTQSAAQNLVNMLERHTQAIFVGEPTGERPNHYGEADEFELPNSHLSVHVSTLWWQDVDPRDTRDATYPQIAAPLSSRDYANNVDPAMTAIFAAYP